MNNQLDVYEILLILQAHMSIPDFVLVGKDMDAMISRSISLNEMMKEIKNLDEADEDLLYKELNRMALRTQEYTALHENLIKGV